MSKSGDWEYHPEGCPVCGRPKANQRCRITVDRGMVKCYYEPRGCIKSGTDDVGEYYLHGRGKDDPAVPVAPKKPEAAKPSIPIADADTRNAVYSAFLAIQSLAKSHRDELNARGLDDETIDARQYRTLASNGTRGDVAGLVDKFGKAAVLGCPGFFVNGRKEAAFACMPGLLIPIRDAAGRINALVSKPDKIGDGAKYLLVSSVSKGGPSPGSPTHVPLGTAPVDGVVRVTEGLLKADVAAFVSGFPTIGMGGVGSRKPVVGILRELGAKTARIAFDADAREKKEVAKALISLAADLRREGFAVELETWDAADGKGIDDVYAAGKSSRVIRGEAVDPALDDICRAAGVEAEGGASKGAETATAEANSASVSDRVMTTLGTHGFAGLYRDKTLLADLANLQTSDASEYAAIVAMLRVVPKFSQRIFNTAIKAAKPKGGARADAKDEGKYFVFMGGIWENVLGDDGQFRKERLSNFTAYIDSQIILKDGQESTVKFVVRVRVEDGQETTVEVPAKEFESMGWLAAKVGAKPIISAGRGIKDRLREAVQILSGDIQTQVVYTHTGWVHLPDGRRGYLSTSGAITADGLDEAVKVDLGPVLGGYRLPSPPVGHRRQAAIRAMFDFLSFSQRDRPGSRSLAAFIATAPVRVVLGRTSFSGYFRGVTGSHKTCAAALIGQHFGPSMTYLNLPIGHDGTAASMLDTLHRLKDTVAIIDDFVPNGGQNDVSAQHREQGRVLRAQGNGQGRARLNQDGTPQPTKGPRGMAIITGEDRNRIRSANARTYPVVLTKDGAGMDGAGSVDIGLLTRFQDDAAAGVYAEGMACYLQYLAAHLDRVKATAEARARELRPLMTRPGDHSRTPDILCDLMSAYDEFLAFAVGFGAISLAESDGFRAVVWDGLMEAAGDARADNQEEGSAAERYLSALVSAVNSNRAFLADRKTDDVPDEWESACGWSHEYKYEHEVGQIKMWVRPANAKRIGWFDGQYVYLDPNVAYTTATEMLGKQGVALPTINELHMQLWGCGKLAKTDGRNKSEGRQRLAARVYVGNSETGRGHQQKVIVIRTADFWDHQPEEPAEEPRAERSFKIQAGEAVA